MNTNIHISRFKGGARDNVPFEGEITWHELYEHLTTVRQSGNGKLTVPAISFVEYGEKKKRRNENVRYHTAACFDIDNKDYETGECVAQPLMPDELEIEYTHLFYSTYNSTPQWPRFRLVVPLAKKITPAQYAVLYPQLVKELGLEGAVDVHTDASRIFFEFHVPHTKNAMWGGRKGGDWVNPDQYVLEPAQSASPESALTGSAADFEAYVANTGENDLDKIRACLFILDPDCPYDEWLRTGMGIHHETNGSDEGFALWHKWSEGAQSSYAGPQDCQERWDSFSGNKGTPTTMASVVQMVRTKEPGWIYTPPEAAEFDPNTLRLKPFTADYLHAIPPPIEWLCEGMINAKVPTMVTGVGNAGKSFIMMELAMCLAHQLPFYGREIPQPHTVFYFNGEDSQNKFKRRVQSWHKQYLDRSGGEPFDFHPERIYYHGPEHATPRLTRKTLEAFIEAVGRTNPINPVIIMDPLRRFAHGNIKEDEDASEYRALTSALCHRIGGTVIDVHHETKVRNLEQASESRQGGHVGLGSTALFDLSRQAFALRLATAEESLQMGNVDVSDTAERTRYVVLEHAKSDEGEITPSVYLKRGNGGVLQQVDVAELIKDRVEQAKEFYLVSPAEDKARDKFIHNLRRNMAKVTDLKGDEAVRTRYMGDEFNSKSHLQEWLSYGTMAGIWTVQARIGIRFI